MNEPANVTPEYLSYEKYGVLLRPSLDWQFDEYGFLPEAMGDCLSYTADQSVERNTTKYLETIADLLMSRKRWPFELQWKYSPFIAKNKLEQIWCDFKYKRGWIEHTKYRPATDMTRDPFVYFYYACSMLNRTQFIEVVTVPWYINRPTLSTWRRYLIVKDNPMISDVYKAILKQRYMFWENLLIKQPRREFAQNLVVARCIAAGCTKLLEKLPEPIPNKG